MKHVFKIINKLKFGKKTRNILIVYAIIFAIGLYILFVDNAFVKNQIIVFERNLNFINDPNSGMVKGNSTPAVDLIKEQPKVRNIGPLAIHISLNKYFLEGSVTLPYHDRG